MDNGNTGVTAHGAIKPIQWYPGHMAKTKRLLAESIGLVDIVIEILDSRIPNASRNPEIEKLAPGKRRLIVLNKADLADPIKTKKWVASYAKSGITALAAESVNSRGLREAMNTAKEMCRDRIEAQKKRGRIFVPVRAMIAGIPNSGKSTFINKLVRRDVAKAADKPGVTRGKQWVRIMDGFELLDTPGILWPRFDDQEAGLRLAFTGAINDSILDTVLLSYDLIAALRVLYPDSLNARYRTEIDAEDANEDALIKIARARGFFLRGAEPDTLRTATMLLDEFRGGKLGRMSLEEP